MKISAKFREQARAGKMALASRRWALTKIMHLYRRGALVELKSIRLKLS